MKKQDIWLFKKIKVDQSVINLGMIQESNLISLKSDEFKELYSERYKIEAKNAELKNQYRYETAQAYGLLA